MLLLLLALSPTASALSSQQSGPSFDLAAGLGVGGVPVQARAGGVLSAGVWSGKYDDSYALGRYWWFGAAGRVDWHPDALTVAPMFEIRRGIDVIVAGASWHVAGGPLVQLPSEGPSPPLGWTARVGLGGKFRRTRYWGFTGRLEAGVDMVAGTPSFAGGVLLGVGFAKPGKQLEPTF